MHTLYCRDDFCAQSSSACIVDQNGRYQTMTSQETNLNGITCRRYFVLVVYAQSSSACKIKRNGRYQTMTLSTTNLDVITCRRYFVLVTLCTAIPSFKNSWQAPGSLLVPSTPTNLHSSSSRAAGVLLHSHCYSWRCRSCCMEVMN